MISETTLQTFTELFSGYEHAHGRYKLKTTEVYGGDKLKGQARTVGQPLTIDDWQHHLEGIGDGIGIIPLHENNTVSFAVIDIDDYKIDIEVILKKIQRFPLVACRSKSGGVHLYMFFKTPLPATLVVDKMREIAAFIGYGKVEIFPKQTYRVDAKDVGNWINLPYFKQDTTERYAFLTIDTRLSLEEFIKLSLDKRQTAEDLEQIGLIDNDTDKNSTFYGAPPCLKYLGAMGGFPQGTKNNGMVNIAVYLKKRFPDNWQQKIAEYAVKMCGTGVPLDEINQIVKSVNKKEYSYLCKQAPVCDHCDKRKCLQQPFGVGNKEQDYIEILSITKYVGEPVLWALDIEGQRIMCDTETLYTQTAFNKLCMEKINRVPGCMPKAKWEKYLDEKIQEADIVFAPEDASATGQCKELIQKFCLGKVQAKTKEEILQGKPYRHEGKIYFIAADLMRYLDTNKFKYESSHWLWMIVKQDLKGDTIQMSIKSVSKRLWCIPDPEPHREKEKTEPSKAKFQSEVF